MSTISSSYDYSELLSSIYSSSASSTSSTTSSTASSSSGLSVSGLLSSSSSGSLSTEAISYLTSIKSAAGSLQSAYSNLAKADTDDADSMVSAMKDFVKSYNSLLSEADSYSNDGAAKLASQLKTISETYGTALSSIGVTVDSDGVLSIDEDKLSTAASDGSLKRFLRTNADGVSNYGFASRLNQLASKVSNDPTAYYKEAAAAKKTADELTLSDFSTGQLQQLVNYDMAGMLLDLSV